MCCCLLCFRFMNSRAAANCRYKPTCYEHAANCYTHAVREHSLIHTIRDVQPSAPRHVTLPDLDMLFFCRLYFIFSNHQNISLFMSRQLLIVPAFVGMALLHRLSDDRWERITAWVYGMGLIGLFLVSTVFHIISWKKSHMRCVFVKRGGKQYITRSCGCFVL